ncbi:hypothetical protein F4604DRAFT_1689897 [Suillus subluteus]|nr:hypothetical protein F4604DRAFT_1689897 [Suillus subluteus]
MMLFDQVSLCLFNASSWGSNQYLQNLTKLVVQFMDNLNFVFSELLDGNQAERLCHSQYNENMISSRVSPMAAAAEFQVIIINVQASLGCFALCLKFHHLLNVRPEFLTSIICITKFWKEEPLSSVIVCPASPGYNRFMFQPPSTYCYLDERSHRKSCKYTHWQPMTNMSTTYRMSPMQGTLPYDYDQYGKNYHIIIVSPSDQSWGTTPLQPEQDLLRANTTSVQGAPEVHKAHLQAMNYYWWCHWKMVIVDKLFECRKMDQPRGGIVMNQLTELEKLQDQQQNPTNALVHNCLYGIEFPSVFGTRARHNHPIAWPRVLNFYSLFCHLGAQIPILGLYGAFLAIVQVRLLDFVQPTMILTPPNHQWQLSNHDADKPPQTSGSPGPEMTHHGIMESGYFDTAATVQDHSESDWQQLWWWTSLMESPLQTAQDDDFLPTMTELAHPNYVNFYREIPSGYCGQSQSTIPHPQASESEGFDWDSELVAAAQYYEHTMHHGFFDAPVAATGGDHFHHDSEMLQALGSSQRLGASHEMSSCLSTTCFDPPLQSYRYMPYPTPARSFQPCASPIPTDQGDVGTAPPAPIIPPAPPVPAIPPAPPAPAPNMPPAPPPPPPPPVPTSIMFGPKVMSQVQFHARECMKTEVFKQSFLMSLTTSAVLAQQCLDKTALNYLNLPRTAAEVTKWSKGSKAQAQVVIMTNTIKNLWDSIKNIIQAHVISGYELQNALTLQIQLEIMEIINNLLQYNIFLYGEINVSN